jgi:hypothetical protein
VVGVGHAVHLHLINLIEDMMIPDPQSDDPGHEMTSLLTWKIMLGIRFNHVPYQVHQVKKRPMHSNHTPQMPPRRH